MSVDLHNLLVMMGVSIVGIGLFLFLSWVKIKGEQRGREAVDQFR
jgi:hypothetical protein